MPDVGLTLNRRVWNLFETAGFETKPNSDNDAEEEVILAGGKRRTLDLVEAIRKRYHDFKRT